MLLAIRGLSSMESSSSVRPATRRRSFLFDRSRSAWVALYLLYLSASSCSVPCSS